MEQQKLPNAQTSLILGIISYIGCCCTSGLLGIILSAIALYLAKKDERLYLENPELYENYKQLKTAKTVAMIGLILSIVAFVGSIIYIIFIGGWAAYMQSIEDLQRQVGQ